MASPAEVVGQLRGRRLSVATAESLTGGLVCAALTDVPGASAVVRGGVIAYASRVKAEVLGVDPTLLAVAGAVDPRVAASMAIGVARLLDARLGVATTGVAGPDPAEGAPVGRVYVAVATLASDAGDEGSVVVRELSLAGTRAQIRESTVAVALEVLAEVAGSIEPDAGPGR